MTVQLSLSSSEKNFKILKNIHKNIVHYIKYL